MISSAALFSAPIPKIALAATSNKSKWSTWDAQVTPANYDPATTNPWGFNPRFLPQRVEANAGLIPGDIHVDAVARYLYHINDDGTAERFGVAIARGRCRADRAAGRPLEPRRRARGAGARRLLQPRLLHRPGRASRGRRLLGDR